MKTFLLLTLFFILTFHLTEANTRFYRATYRDDPSNSIVIGWCDSVLSTNANVYFGTQDFGTAWNMYPSSHTIDRSMVYFGLTNNFARINGLTPDTKYYFVIHDDQGTSARMTFETLPDNPDTPISFINGADSRTGILGEFEYEKCRQRRQYGNMLVAKMRTDFVVFEGDFVYASTDSLWYDWLSDWQLSISSTGRVTPIVPVVGNHESAIDVYNLFDIPNAASNFALPIGGNLLRLYALNSNLSCDSTMNAWLTADLQQHTGNQNTPYWKVAAYHHALMPHGNYSSQTALISCWPVLFKNYNVKLAMEGHSHLQKITYPIVTSSDSGSYMGFVRNDSSGTTYIGEGSWGAPMRDCYTYYNSDKAYKWTLAQGKFAGFNVICVSKLLMEIRTVFIDSIANVGQVSETDPACTFPSGVYSLNTEVGSVVTLNRDTVTGIQEAQGIEPNVAIYPNPVSDIVTVNIQEYEMPVNIELHETTGKLLKSVRSQKHQHSVTLDFNNLPEGFYFIVIKGIETQHIFKVIHVR
jgi:hypothetical protein